MRWADLSRIWGTESPEGAALAAPAHQDSRAPGLELVRCEKEFNDLLRRTDEWREHQKRIRSTVLAWARENLTADEHHTLHTLFAGDSE